MSKNKKDSKIDESKLEGLKVIGGKDGYNPAKEKEVEEEIFTSPVKIGDKEYIIKPLSMLDIRKLSIERRNIKKDDETATYDYTFYTLLTVIKKWNPETKDISVEEFEEMIGADEFIRVQAAIIQLAGLKKYFGLGGSR
ncbi:hypothetical protein ES704_01027 [subsurface metagenome]|jgi:hypothetical protein